MFAYRALKMWRRSWLSREVLLFGAFSQVAFVYAAMLWLGLPASRVVGALTVLAGAAGVTASACIYLVRPRPAWRSKHTLGEFYLSGAILGPLLGAAIGLGARQWLLIAAVAAAGLQLLNLAIKFLWLVSSEVFELKASARLLSTQLRSLLLLRSALLIVGGMILPLESRGIGSLTSALALAFCGEILGRYLFFVTVVPKNMAAAYLGSHKAGA
jgi:DMSO reductase anchor subunit